MAGLGRKEWSPGDTLTAADVNGYLMDQSVMVFAGTAARASAIPTPSAGMVAYSTATNLEYYDGAAWEPVGVPPGLVVVKPETPFTTSNSIVADGVFTSAYRNYTIKFTSTASTGVGWLFKLRVGGVAASTNYNYQLLSANSSTLTGIRYSSQTSGEAGSIAVQESALTLNLYNPAVAVATNYDVINAYVSGAFTSPVSYFYTGNHSTATAYDGIEMLPTSGTLTGSYTIYGWGK